MPRDGFGKHLRRLNGELALRCHHCRCGGSAARLLRRLHEVFFQVLCESSRWAFFYSGFTLDPELLQICGAPAVYFTRAYLGNGVQGASSSAGILKARPRCESFAVACLYRRGLDTARQYSEEGWYFETSDSDPVV